MVKPLCSVAARTDPHRWLLGAARNVAACPELWRAHLRRDSGERWHALLWAHDELEAWLLGWPAGEATELHDHGGSAGAFIVVEGILLETYLDPRGWTSAGGVLRGRRLRPGALVGFGADHIHDMVNAVRRQALSIHVYSPRLRSMTFYETRPDHGLVAVRTEVTETAAQA